ncbi:MAG: hypothetical protein WBF90_11950 [Rivularia sp. (in: cyanobacteria)]
MRSKIVALFLVLGLAASVTACGGSQDTETGEDSTSLTEETVDTKGADIKSGEDIPESIEETEEKAN